MPRLPEEEIHLPQKYFLDTIPYCFLIAVRLQPQEASLIQKFMLGLTITLSQVEPYLKALLNKRGPQQQSHIVLPVKNRNTYWN